MKYLHIKNWKKFQHYQHRSPPWVKLHFEMFTSADWVALADDSKLAMMVCMLIGSRHDGKVPNDPAYIKRIAYLNKPINLKPLIECGFLTETLADDSAMQAQASKSKPMQASTSTETEKELDTEKEKKEDIRAVAKATRSTLDEDFQKFKEAYPKREGANPWQPARKAFASALKAGFTAEEMISGAARYAFEDRDKIGTAYIAQAVTWLRQQRWKDYADRPPSTDGPAAPPGKPSNEELTAKYSRKPNETAGTDQDRLEQSSSVVQGGARPRNAEPKLVRDETGFSRVRGMGGLLSQNGLGSNGVQNTHGGQGNDDADEVARVVPH